MNLKKQFSGGSKLKSRSSGSYRRRQPARMPVYLLGALLLTLVVLYASRGVFNVAICPSGQEDSILLLEHVALR
jgi:hypothetical protein